MLPNYVIMSCMCFQYATKLRHNVIYVFSIFNSDVITPNLGNYRTDMTISSTALNQSKTLELFSINNNEGGAGLYIFCCFCKRAEKHSFFTA